MTFSLMLTVNAANPVKTFDNADQITEAFVESADVLTGMKVFQGDERGFAPASTITRAETALIYRIATGDVKNEREGMYANYGNFSGVNPGGWFAGYASYCATAGFIKGTTPTTFNPHAPVTGYEALAMILRAIGYDKNHEFKGNQWIVNVPALASRLGILGYETTESTGTSSDRYSARTLGLTNRYIDDKVTGPNLNEMMYYTRSPFTYASVANRADQVDTIILARGRSELDRPQQPGLRGQSPQQLRPGCGLGCQPLLAAHRLR